jgi:hypothetical protein
MFLWYPVLDLARAPRRAARKKGSGYENARVQAWPVNIQTLAIFINIWMFTPFYS